MNISSSGSVLLGFTARRWIHRLSQKFLSLTLSSPFSFFFSSIMVLVEIVGNISGKALSKDNQSPPFQRIKAGIVTGTVNILFSAVVVQRRKKSYAVFLPFCPSFFHFPLRWCQELLISHFVPLLHLGSSCKEVQVTAQLLQDRWQHGYIATSYCPVAGMKTEWQKRNCKTKFSLLSYNLTCIDFQLWLQYDYRN